MARRCPAHISAFGRAGVADPRQGFALRRRAPITDGVVSQVFGLTGQNLSAVFAVHLVGWGAWRKLMLQAEPGACAHLCGIAAAEPTWRSDDPLDRADFIATIAFEKWSGGAGRAVRGNNKLWLEAYRLAQEAAVALYCDGISEAEWIAAVFAALEARFQCR
jgi:hypothetical protein